jgi:flagellar biosynthesis protein FlhA
VIVTHLTETIRGHAAQLLTRQDVRQLLDQLKAANEAVVNEVVPDVLTLGEIQRVLQGCWAKGVSIRDLGAIVEAVGDKARLTRDPSLLAEYARQALGRAITAPHLDAERTLHAITPRPGARAGGRRRRSRRRRRASSSRWSPAAPRRSSGRSAANPTMPPPTASRPVLLCSARVRRHLRRLLEASIPHLSVCSYNEIAPGISVETIGVISA